MNPKLSSSIVAAASILIFFLLVLPSYDQTRALKSSIKEREDILSEAQEISGQIAGLNREIETRRQDIDKLNRLLPGEKEVPELLSGLESVVSASGMTLTEMNLSDVAGPDEVKKISANLKLSGGFTSFINFLDLLEKNLRLIEVSAFDVAAQLIEGSKNINYDVRFEVNYLPK